MITPQLTEQYGQVLRVSVVRSIFNPCVCAYTGARLNPKTLTPAPPIKVVLMKVLLERSIRHYLRVADFYFGYGSGAFSCRGYEARLGASTIKANAIFWAADY